MSDSAGSNRRDGKAEPLLAALEGGDERSRAKLQPMLQRTTVVEAMLRAAEGEAPNGDVKAVAKPAFLSTSEYDLALQRVGASPSPAEPVPVPGAGGSEASAPPASSGSTGALPAGESGAGPWSARAPRVSLSLLPSSHGPRAVDGEDVDRQDEELRPAGVPRAGSRRAVALGMLVLALVVGGGVWWRAVSSGPVVSGLTPSSPAASGSSGVRAAAPGSTGGAGSRAGAPEATAAGATAEPSQAVPPPAPRPRPSGATHATAVPVPGPPPATARPSATFKPPVEIEDE